MKHLAAVIRPASRKLQHHSGIVIFLKTIEQMKIGTWILIIGLAMLLGSFIPAGAGIYNAFNKNTAQQLNIEVGSTHRTKIFNVNTEQLVQVAIEIDTHNSAKESNTDNYSFPLSYRIFDQYETVIHQKDTAIEWNSESIENTTISIDNDITTSRTRSSTGNISTVKFSLEKIHIDPPGLVQVEVTLSPDTAEQSTINTARLLVYDNVYTYWSNLFSWLALLILGFGITILGVILVIAQQFTTSNQPDQVVQPTSTPLQNNIEAKNTDKSQQWAMYTHLSAYSGFIIPFGGLIGPLVIWLMKKDEHPFIDSNGREALNFNISMFIYTFISFILIFVFIGFLLLAILFIIYLITPLVAGINANAGKSYRYPLTIRFI